MAALSTGLAVLVIAIGLTPKPKPTASSELEARQDAELPLSQSSLATPLVPAKDDVPSPRLTAGEYGELSLTAKQANHAATIIEIGRQLGASDRDITIALMTALQESMLRNLDYGDDWWHAPNESDSIGLFQQRDHWGSEAERLNPEKSSRLFFQALLELNDREQLSPGAAAQLVQGSAFPDEYDQWEATAKSLLRSARQPSGNG
ncbi:MAG: hypothetical protein Kow00121_66210 [Elainellaceae cyanobacterium]